MSRADTQETKSPHTKREIIKKMPLELTRFEGELEEFTHKSMMEPANSSFFTALGLGILETLVRLKPKGFLAESAWKGISEKLGLIDQFAKDMRLTDCYENFKAFIKKLKQADRRTAWKMLESSYDNSLTQINLEQGTKLMICSFIDQDYKLIMSGTLGFNIILSELAKKLSVHLVHIENNTYTVYKHKNIAPIVYIYSKHKHFGVVYHMSVKYLDEKKSDTFGIDFRSFPFLYNPSKPFIMRIQLQKNSASSEFIEVLSILAQNLKPMDANSKASLLLHISSLKNLCPEIEDSLQEVYEQAISLCGHQGKEYTPVCLQSHCLDCLVDLVLDSTNGNVMCPCGVLLDASDIMFLTSDNLEVPRYKEGQHRNSSVPPIQRVEEREKEKEKRSDRILRKRSIKERRSSFSQDLQRLPVINNKIPCSVCRRGMDSDKYDGVKCVGHQICLECRVKKMLNGQERCPACKRFYNNHELTILRMMHESIDLTSTILKAENFIDTL